MIQIGAAENHALQRVRHIRILDGVRAIAILYVLFHHVAWAIPQSRWLQPVHTVASFGWCGVDLFFVLSGFLISGILIDTREAANYFRSFYARRTLRIFPVYYATLCALVLAAAIFARVRNAIPQHPIFCFLYLDNWTDPYVPVSRLYITGHFWSLAVEEQFYLLWPLCVRFIPVRRLKAVCISGVLLALAVRIVLVLWKVNEAFIYKALFTRMDTLLIGALCAVAIREPKLLLRLQRFAGKSAIALGCVAFGIAVFLHQGRSYMPTAGYTLLALTFGCFILWAYAHCNSGASLPRFLRSKALVQIGKYSYGMYIFHVPLVYLLHHAVQPHFWVAIPLILPLSFAIAKLSYDLFESRFLRLKDRFRPIPRHHTECQKSCMVRIETSSTY
jgi:peptidoglycan/LPS O-acetylase OafA/YrhL